MLNFFIKRSIRLDPPFWATILILLTLNFIATFLKADTTPFPSFDQILINIFYLPDLMDVPRILPVSWTLSLEIQFYLFFILLVKFIQSLNIRFSKENSQVFSFPALSIILTCMLVSILQNTPYGLFSTPGLFVYKWYSFMIGFLICWRMLNYITPAFFWLNLGILCCFALFYDLQILETCLVALFLYFMATQDKMHSYLTSQIFQYLGKISYSLYLIHWISGIKFISLTLHFIDISKQSILFPYLLMMASLALTIFAADLFYRLIEKPSLKLSQKISLLNKQNASTEFSS